MWDGMKRSASILSIRQGVCFFCALRLRSANLRALRQSAHTGQPRFYGVSTALSKPAGPAVAQKEDDGEEEYPSLPKTSRFRPHAGRSLPTPAPAPQKRQLGDLNPLEALPGWKCYCSHFNLPNRGNCALCDKPRGASAALRSPPQPAPKNLFSRTHSNALSDTPFSQRQSLISTGQYCFSPGQGRSAESSSYLPHRARPEGNYDIAPVRSRGGHASREGTLVRHAPATDRNDRSRLEEVFELEDRTREHVVNRRDSGSFRPKSRDNPHLARSRIRQDPARSSGDRIDTVPSTPTSTEFKPFVRRVGSKDGGESGQRLGDTGGQPFRFTESSEKVSAGIGTTFLPPASSTFDNYATERRRKRGGSERRNERYQLDDTDKDSQQTKKNRNTVFRTSRRSQRDLDDDLLLEDEFEERRKSRVKKVKSHIVRTKPILQLPDFISVEQLARVLKVRIDPFLRKLEEEGFDGARYDHILDAESSAMIAESYGLEASFGGRQTVEDLSPLPAADDKSLLPPRPPVVTIMGHVDHGKTTILDWLRKSSVVASEHGGITQHIGAFSVTMPDSERQITFLDTPGHAAFLDMRRRGAVVTDIVVLVVAADDSVKPQTVEAVKHALEAKVPIIVAINKVDKEDANVERVKQDLARNDITVEDYGGDYQAIALSGKTGKGMEELEEAILALADVSDFRAEIDGQAEGWILESKVTLAGRVATILVRRGTLRVGDFIVAGTTWARVRTLRNDTGVLVDEALPGTPIQVDGWRGEDPTAGLEVLQAEGEQHAKDVVGIRQERLESLRIAGDLSSMNTTRTEEAEARAKVLAWEAEQIWAKKKRKPADNEGWIEGSASNGPRQVHFVIKADVAGSVEALVAAVGVVGNNEIQANVIHSETGVLSESDIRYLAATGETGYAISFNQPVDGGVSQLARAAGLQILDHNIIYKVTDDVKEKLSAELPPLVTQRVLGEAEVGQVFEITTKQGRVKIAGCKIKNGSVSRSHMIRVLRKGETVYTGKLDSLKNMKKDVTEIRKGSECGMGFSDWRDFQEGDQVQAFEEESTPRVLY